MGKHHSGKKRQSNKSTIVLEVEERERIKENILKGQLPLCDVIMSSPWKQIEGLAQTYCSYIWKKMQLQ